MVCVLPHKNSSKYRHDCIRLVSLFHRANIDWRVRNIAYTFNVCLCIVYIRRAQWIVAPIVYRLVERIHTHTHTSIALWCCRTTKRTHIFGSVFVWTSFKQYIPLMSQDPAICNLYSSTQKRRTIEQCHRPSQYIAFNWISSLIFSIISNASSVWSKLKPENGKINSIVLWILLWVQPN